ncbi:hypothetical protein HZB74_01930 [Candidatus Saccharibacteria bacterium]|nr:hypothetical protein [Candidatus Saccharibacteria bacterium]
MEECEPVSSCAGCPKPEVFNRINEALKSDIEPVRDAGRLGVSLLSLVEAKGPSSITTGETGNLPYCCKQAVLGFVNDTITRTEHAVRKNN